jgi:integrase
LFFRVLRCILDKVGQDEEWGVAKKVRDMALDSKEARRKLRVSGKPYWRSIGRGVHLGYRKGKAGGVWVVRRYLGDQTYKVETIATADDSIAANGSNILDYWQAQRKVHALLDTVTDPSRYTVREAIADYIVSLEGKPTQRSARQRLAAYVPDALADKPVVQVTAQELEAWLRNMVKLPPRVHTAEGAKQNYRKVDMSDPEVQRQRRSSANRVMTNLRAALNYAFDHNKVASDAACRVKAFRGADSARLHYLTIAEAQRFINVCDPDFRVLVQAALATGARYSELTRLTVADFNPDSGTLYIHRSKSGDAGRIVLTEEGVELFASLAAGRTGSTLLFGRRWRANQQIRAMNRACELAKIEPRITFHGLRHTWASLSVMAGLPLMVVAKNLGHVNTTMVEAHYGHLAPSYVAEEIRKHAPRFGGVTSNVKAIRS